MGDNILELSNTTLAYRSTMTIENKNGTIDINIEYESYPIKLNFSFDVYDFDIEPFINVLQGLPPYG